MFSGQKANCHFYNEWGSIYRVFRSLLEGGFQDEFLGSGFFAGRVGRSFFPVAGNLEEFPDDSAA
jgi:hypothetical protein